MFKKWYISVHNLHSGPIWAIPWGRGSLHAISLPIFFPMLKMLHISNEKSLPAWEKRRYGRGQVVRPGLIGLQNRLCGPLLCSKNNTFLYIICILDPFGPSRDVEGQFKHRLCWFSFPFEKCHIFPTRFGSRLGKTEVRSRSGCLVWSLLCSKIASVGNDCVQKIIHFFT